MAPATRGFRLLALAAALGAWALVAVGGIVRASESGLGCPDWPLCDGRVVPVRDREPWIETSHRWVAGLVSVLVVLVAVWAWRRYRGRRGIVLPAVAAALLVPGQALLGAVVVWLELPGWIVGVHFLVAMAFLAATVAAASAAWRDRVAVPVRPSFASLAWATAGLGLVAVVLGAAVVSADAGHACGTSWPDCNGAFAAGGGEAWLQVAHRSAAYGVAVLAFLLAASAVRGAGPRLAGSAPLAASALQVGLGVSLVLAGEGHVHSVLEALHVSGAGSVWAALVALAALVGPPLGFAAPLALPARAR